MTIKKTSFDLPELLSSIDSGAKACVVYHANCPDGFAAALAAWMRLGDAVEYIPYDHEKPPSIGLLSGKIVAMCDCCYPKNLLAEAALEAQRLLVLDHHASSMAECSGFDFCRFDLERSGAAMAWDFFHPSEKRPLLIECVQDRDLHRHELPETGPFCSKLDSIPMDFDQWRRACELKGEALARFLREGREMLAQFEAQALSMAACAKKVIFKGRRCMLLNAPYRFASRCGAILCEDPWAQMALIWNSDDLRTARLSLRSRSGVECDVSKIASELGGGGHPISSGARVGLAQLAELCEDAPVDRGPEKP